MSRTKPEAERVRSVVTPRFGFDLWPAYEDTVEAELPDELRRLGDQLVAAEETGDGPEPDGDPEERREP